MSDDSLAELRAIRRILERIDVTLRAKTGSWDDHRQDQGRSDRTNDRDQDEPPSGGSSLSGLTARDLMSSAPRNGKRRRWSTTTRRKSSTSR